jgi:hypothetical protein
MIVSTQILKDPIIKWVFICPHPFCRFLSSDPSHPEKTNRPIQAEHRGVVSRRLVPRSASRTRLFLGVRRKNPVGSQQHSKRGPYFLPMCWSTEKGGMHQFFFRPIAYISCFFSLFDRLIVCSFVDWHQARALVPGIDHTGWPVPSWYQVPCDSFLQQYDATICYMYFSDFILIRTYGEIL